MVSLSGARIQRIPHSAEINRSTLQCSWLHRPFHVLWCISQHLCLSFLHHEHGFTWPLFIQLLRWCFWDMDVRRLGSNMLRLCAELRVLACSHNLSTREAEAEGGRLEAGLVYTMRLFLPCMRPWKDYNLFVPLLPSVMLFSSGHLSLVHISVRS